MASDDPVVRVYGLVGAARTDGLNSLRLDDLLERMLVALEVGESIKLGFYDGGYPESAEFWPMKLEEDDNVRPLRWTRVFIGRIGFEKRLPGCLTISERDGDVDALLTIVTPY